MFDLQAPAATSRHGCVRPTGPRSPFPARLCSTYRPPQPLPGPAWFDLRPLAGWSGGEVAQRALLSGLWMCFVGSGSRSEP